MVFVDFEIGKMCKNSYLNDACIPRVYNFILGIDVPSIIILILYFFNNKHRGRNCTAHILICFENYGMFRTPINQRQTSSCRDQMCHVNYRPISRFT